MHEQLVTKKLNGHLIEGLRPIFVSLGSYQDYKKIKEEHPNDPNLDNNFLLHNPTDVKWGISTSEMDEAGFLHGGQSTYVMSQIDDSDKYTKVLFGCTSVVVSGIDKNTHRNLSFLTHQFPLELNDNAELNKNFVRDLQIRLREIKDQCITGTIDAVVVGGIHGGNNAIKREGVYSKTINLIGQSTKEVIGFEPMVVNGPKTNFSASDVYDNVYYDNTNRRLYVVRPVINPEVNSFIPSDFNQQKDNL